MKRTNEFGTSGEGPEEQRALIENKTGEAQSDSPQTDNSHLKSE